MLGCVGEYYPPVAPIQQLIRTGNIPNGGISNFGTLIIKGFGFSTLVTTLMQVCLFSNLSLHSQNPNKII
jgi:hypothetical protein